MAYFYNFLSSPFGLLFLLFSTVTAIVAASRERLLDRIVSASAVLLAIVGLGLRDKYSGTDTERYWYFFENIAHFDYEPGFELLIWLLNFLMGPQEILASLVAFQLIILLSAGRKIGIESGSLLVIGYMSTMVGFDLLTNAVRQGVATALMTLIICSSFVVAERSRLWLLLPIAFHKSALVAVIFAFVRKSWSLRALNIWLIGVFWFVFAVSGAIKEIYVQTAIADILSIPIFGTRMLLSEKLMVYFTAPEKVVTGLFKYYFLSIPMVFHALHLFARKHDNGIDSNEKITKLLFATNVLLLIYAATWSGAYSYRFLYLAYPMMLIASIKLVERLKSGRLIFLSYLFFFLHSVLTYGSETFGRFGYSYF